jgi:hypothetical protein
MTIYPPFKEDAQERIEREAQEQIEREEGWHRAEEEWHAENDPE